MKRDKINTYLFLGLLGAVITLAGELLQGYAAPVSGQDAMLALLQTHGALPVWRLGLGSTVGAAGILLQYFGMYAICLSLKAPKEKTVRNFRLGICNYTVLGAMVHILMSLMLYVYKLDAGAVADFTLWFVVPITAVFLVGYAWFSVILFNAFRKKETVFPAWCCVLNPVLGKAVINAFAAALPVSALSNAVSYSNMGITAVIMFGALLILRKQQK